MEARYKKSEAILTLERMAIDEAHRKDSTMPYLEPRLYRDDSTNALTRCVVDFLRLSGWQAERVNSTGRYIDDSKIVTDVTGIRRRIGRDRWIYSPGQKDPAEISTTIKEHPIKIEVKTGQDTQSENQKQYQKEIEQSGGIYLLISDFESFLHAYNQLIIN